MIVLIASCSVEKRRYNRGLHITWRGHADKPQQAKDSLPRAHEPASPPQSLPLQKPTLSDGPCDVVYFKDGGYADIKLLCIAPYHVEYKRCDVPDGPTYVRSKSAIAAVIHGNGTWQTFETVKPAAEEPVKKNAKARWALAFGIMGYTGIAAIVLASMAKKEIERAEGRQKGARTVRAAFILGITRLILVTLVIATIVAGA